MIVVSGGFCPSGDVWTNTITTDTKRSAKPITAIQVVPHLPTVQTNVAGTGDFNAPDPPARGQFTTVLKRLASSAGVKDLVEKDSFVAQSVARDTSEAMPEWRNG